MSRAHKAVDIYGAGLAGLVAAISLAREGYKVHVLDRYGIGGNRNWHPSIQTTVLNLEQTSEYIGIDLSGCFRRVDSITFYRYGRKKLFTLDNMYICERGPREKAIDVFLYKEAICAGAEFHSVGGSIPDRSGASEKVIIATGLETQTYEQLGLPYVPLYGYRGLRKAEHNRMLITYMCRCTNYDFAYLAADNGLLFGLLFSRQGLAASNLERFEKVLKATEGVEFDKWTYSTGALPTQPRLLHRRMVLAGTLSGMIDPFLLHGLSGALVSGKIAAQAFVAPERARCEFRRLVRNFGLKKRLKALSTRLPMKQLTLPLMMWIDSHLAGVGFV